MNHSILDALHDAGINQCSVETDTFTHSIKVRIGQGDNVHTAAQILWECLPAGVLTLGDTTIGVADGVGGIHPIRISRLYDTHEVFEDEDYDLRGRVCQPLMEGWTRVQPPTEGSCVACTAAEWWRGTSMLGTTCTCCTSMLGSTASP
jgi:hypothetical protein